MGLSERPSREIPGARLELIAGLAHCPHEESPSLFNAILLSALVQ
jgi:pimeloyl-ACP methyl ester carboxylesterase